MRAWREVDLRSPGRAAAPLLVLGLGLLFLQISAPGANDPGPLATSDEVVYAAMARNIATGRGAISNFYDALSIVRRGFPLGDVHMPGYAFVLGASVRVFGIGPFALLLPSAGAFLLTGLLLFLLGRRHFDDEVGVGAALAFFAFPGLAFRAHLVMPEMLLVLLTGGFVAVWLRARSRHHLADAALLALALGLGTTVRETFLAFLPAAAWALWRWPAPARLRAGAAFTLVFGAYASLVLVPLAQARAPYPNFLSEILDLPGSSIAAALLANVLRNLEGLPRLHAHPTGWVFAWLGVSGLLLPLLGWRQRGALRDLALLVLSAYAVTVAALLGVYPLRDRSWAEGAVALPVTWGAGERALLSLCAPSALLLVAVLRRVDSRLARSLLLGVVVAGGVLANRRHDPLILADRVAAQRYDWEFSRVVAAASAPFAPVTVLAEGAFLYGWQAYPVKVLWRATAQPAEIAALERVVPIDLVFVGGARRREIEDAVTAGLLAGGYRTVAEPARGVFLMASAECLRRAAPGALRTSLP